MAKVNEYYAVVQHSYPRGLSKDDIANRLRNLYDQMFRRMQQLGLGGISLSLVYESGEANAPTPAGVSRFQGAMGNTPHVNIIASWESGRSMQLNIFQLFVETYFPGQNVHVQPVYDLARLLGYLSKPDRRRVQYGTEYGALAPTARRPRDDDEDEGPPARRQRFDDSEESDEDITDFDDPGPPPPDMANVDLDLTPAPSKDVKGTMMKSLEDAYSNKTVRCLEDMKMLFNSAGNLSEYVKSKKFYDDYLTMKLEMDGRAKRDSRIKALPIETAEAWKRYVLGQEDGFALLFRYSRMMQDRDQLVDKKSTYLLGPTRCGKSWSLNFLHDLHDTGMINPSEKGVGRNAPLLSSRTVIIDDPNREFFMRDRQSMLGMLAGDPFPVKIHSTTRTRETAVHIVITHNKELVNREPELVSRLRVFDMKTPRQFPRRWFTEYNRFRVRDYLTYAAPFLEQMQVPCMCMSEECPPVTWSHGVPSSSLIHSCPRMDMPRLDERIGKRVMPDSLGGRNMFEEQPTLYHTLENNTYESASPSGSDCSTLYEVVF